MSIPLQVMKHSKGGYVKFAPHPQAKQVNLKPMAEPFKRRARGRYRLFSLCFTHCAVYVNQLG